MRFPSLRQTTAVILSLLALTAAGCHYGTECCVEHRVGQLGSAPIDATALPRAVTPPPPATPSAGPSAADPAPAFPSRRPVQDDSAAWDGSANAHRAVTTAGSGGGAVRHVTYADDEVPPPTAAPPRFAIPHELPGADAPPLRLPPIDPQQSLRQRQSQIESLFQSLPALSAQPPVPADAAAVTLAELQQLAHENNPQLRQAAAAVEHARGLAIQAGLWPNPVAGFQQDTVGSGGTAGQNGGFIAQEFVTAKKKRLARNTALMDVCAAQLALQRTRVEVASAVRGNYLAVLIAQERLKITRAMAQLTEDAYRAQIELVAGGEAAAYEPLQLRVFAVTYRNAVLRAENAYRSSWRQLAASVGLPEMAPARVAGSVDMPVPEVSYEAARNHLLNRHPDLAIAQTQIDKALFNLRLQRVTPIPNVTVEAVLQRDTTALPNSTTYNLQVGVPLPVFDDNRGNVIAAEAQLVNAQQTWRDTRNSLTANLAEIYGRYASNKTITERFRSDILSDQVRTCRGIYERFRKAGDNVDFSQVVVSQQALMQVLNDYFEALSQQWQAVVDLAEILQVDDLFQMDAVAANGSEPVPPSGE